MGGLWQAVTVGFLVVVSLAVAMACRNSEAPAVHLAPPLLCTPPIKLWLPPTSAFFHIFLCRAVDFWHDSLGAKAFKVVRSGEYDIAVLCEDNENPEKIEFHSNFGRCIAMSAEVGRDDLRDREIARCLGRCLGYSYDSDPLSVMCGKPRPGRFHLPRGYRSAFEAWRESVRFEKANPSTRKDSSRAS